MEAIPIRKSLFKRAVEYLGVDPESFANTVQQYGGSPPAHIVRQLMEPAPAPETFEQGAQYITQGMKSGGAFLPGVTGMIGQIKAYHGSPHRFEQFKNEAIGTGEGAQAFGYGHYLTEEQAIGQRYADKLGKVKVPGLNSDEVQSIPGWIISDLRRTLEQSPHAFSNRINNRIEDIKGIYYQNPGYFEIVSSRLKKIEKAVKSGEKFEKEGNIYEATLHKGKQPGEYEYLRWDERLKDQPKVIEALKSEGYPVDVWLKSNLTGEGVYQSAVAHNSNLGIGNPAKYTSETLKKAGIDGIKYPAGSLSGMKSNKFNYVVFDPADITVETIGGKPVAKSVQSVAPPPKVNIGDFVEFDYRGKMVQGKIRDIDQSGGTAWIMNRDPSTPKMNDGQTTVVNLANIRPITK